MQTLRFSDIFIESMGWSCFWQRTCSFKWIYKPEIPPTRGSNPCRPWLHTCGWLCSAELIIPSFTKGKKQLSAKEVETSRKISSVRIHIERVIGLKKNRYTILKGPLPIIVIKSFSDEVEDWIVIYWQNTACVCVPH
jgi:hypothetical protein